MNDFYQELRLAAAAVIERHGLMAAPVKVRARVLSPEEAIGNPEADDFPIQKGKERMMQATVKGAPGQAFTDRFGDFEGTLQQILETPLSNNYRRAIFVAAVNAVLRHLGLVKGTVHCRDQGPAQCARALSEYIQELHGRVNICIVGYQPRMVETLACRFPVRVLDMDPDNIGTAKFGAEVESPGASRAAVAWADLLLVTGTTLVNGTLPDFLSGKPIMFYGTTIAGAAHLMGLSRFCASSL